MDRFMTFMNWKINKQFSLIIVMIIIGLCSVSTASAQSGEFATVYFYSLAAPPTLGSIKKSIFVDGKEVAKIRPEHYFIVKLEPGTHAFHLKNKKIGGVEKNFEAGKIYYLRIEWEEGMTVKPSGISSVSAESGAYDIKQLRPVDEKQIIDKRVAMRILAEQ